MIQTAQDKKSVAFYTLGCKLNFSETSTIARDFDKHGYEKKEFDEPADIYVINTCSVTENADKRFKSIVKRAQKQNADAFTIAVGCYAQLKPEELAAVDGVDLVLGATEKFKITDYINQLSKDEPAQIHSCEIDEADFYVGSYSIGDRTRAFLKVQDGCDYKCTYCTIPLARGISRSDTMENVLQNASDIAAQDIKEIVLTGVNIGDYGKGEFGNKKHEHTFLDLVTQLDQVEGIERLRISSIEPNLLKNETIELVARSRAFVPHFHIPLQSGNNELLGKMKRRYRRELYVDRVAKIKEVMPDCCIGVDVIVGFPGESDDHFLDTYNFLSELDISYLHVFTYSERENTEAAVMKDVVPISVRKKRSKMLRGLSVKKRRAFYESQLGKSKTVLWEAENKEGFIHGFTENYVKVKTYYNPELINQLQAVKLVEIDEDGLVRVEIL
ncbi:tRNA (N(6)-L-threonylcarbamoyladenosine(37)-C(2))-methylthiotransferase MtaB [Nonlabens ponticola]|uniref:tRNA (N(6)-L-threonylcarbamoyladenosine(37)-C(2))-methylthiotransferase MtaB n=1 Tax=Nonlabens ponticola TaxID=2496866 RepID=A0A3S9MYH9_9FLAO|nr:tRNA (N(6)-L-threonylcarbamoyladenosine(37)-C(2))-methylthiotransferase MtaB [Nonlabens ponticola]AZQ44306.1 tRNA (N(6)-L-threonylcarbamoyladenosine(37)-C(2))-methylthiotransferase MtaB [Nonlabens ponticola]